MSKYRIILEGKTYEMEVDLIEENSDSKPSEKKTHREFKTPGNNSTVREMDSSAQKQTVANTGAVTSPMPGTVINIEKKVGDEVKAGELVLILEAMKMENEILAPSDGRIVKMNCEVGGTVAGGDVLFEVR